MKPFFFIASFGVSGCTMTEAASPAAEHVVAGQIQLSPALTGAVKPNDQIVIVAKRSAGAPPLAVKKVAVGEFPVRFELEHEDLAGEIEVMVRVDKDGNPYTRSPGDLFGKATGVRVGSQQVDVTISEVLP